MNRVGTNKIKDCFVIFFICLFFVGQVSGWGPETQKHICEQAVMELWGEEVFRECLTETPENKKSICEFVKDIKDARYYQVCMENPQFSHPALIPYTVFNDTRLHYNYGSCPISEHEKIASQWMCNDSGENLAIKEAEFWLRISNESSEVCRSVYAFGIASNYFSDSYMPLYQVTYALPKSMDEMDYIVDNKILENKSFWRIQVSSIFQYNTRRSVRRFYVTKEDIYDIISMLVAEGEGLNAPKPTLGEDPIVAPKPISEENISEVGNLTESKPHASLPDEESCSLDSDCLSSYCYEGLCRTPDCLDGIRNQGEEKVDCGGPCSPCLQPVPLDKRITEKLQVLLDKRITEKLPIAFVVAILVLSAIIFALAKKPRKSLSHREKEETKKQQTTNNKQQTQKTTNTKNSKQQTQKTTADADHEKTKTRDDIQQKQEESGVVDDDLREVTDILDDIKSILDEL